MASPSSYSLHSIGVFAGSTPGKNPHFLEAPDNLGKLLAANDINVVYGGGTTGLMDLPLVGPTIGDELKVSNIQDRVISMLHNADAFIALPGGFGTLEELFHIITWAQLNIHHKPVGILNIDGFYDGLLAFFDSMVEMRFISPISRRIILCANSAEELLNKFRAYEPQPDPILSHINWTGANDRRKRKLDLTLTL
ncbi:hypothetical protein OROMI_034264 [Orobanche minor]